MANKKRIFVSYHFDRDKNYKNLLLAWNSNSHFDFHMRDDSADLSVNSIDSAVIKRTISAKINKGNYFIVIIGSATKSCEWVKWEIKKAKELKKKIVAVKINRRHQAPDELYGAGAAWAYSFKLDAITNALKKVQED
jgi:hypothetical protein